MLGIFSRDMLSNYKVYSLDDGDEMGSWKTVEKANDFFCYYSFYLYEHRPCIGHGFRKKNFKGMVSIFKIENIEIKVPQNKLIICNIVDEIFYDRYVVNIYLLFLLSFSKKKYLLIPENIFIKFQYYLNYYRLNVPIFNSKYYVMED